MIVTDGKTYPGQLVFGLDIGTRSIVGTVGYLEDKQFHIVAQQVKEHDTRAMIDGQIHDIEKVGETIREVKEALEEKLSGRALKEVCIAAAGRVLRTVTTRVDEELEEEILVEIEAEELVADVFREYGVDDMPQGDLLIPLLNPVLHFWQDSENEIPSFGASLTALPPSQVVFSKNTLMNDSTIFVVSPSIL